MRFSLICSNSIIENCFVAIAITFYHYTLLFLLITQGHESPHTIQDMMDDPFDNSYKFFQNIFRTILPICNLEILYPISYPYYCFYIIQTLIYCVLSFCYEGMSHIRRILLSWKFLICLKLCRFVGNLPPPSILHYIAT